MTEKKDGIYFIGCDMHKEYSNFAVLDGRGKVVSQVRLPHDGESLELFYRSLPPGSEVAVEASRGWYWMIDLIEECGHVPHLVHAGKAKAMMGHIHKTDKLDSVGLGKLLYLGSLPTVWIPPGEIRDVRELLRVRMGFSRVRTSVKNQIHAQLGKWGVRVSDVSDLFGISGREKVKEVLDRVPRESRHGIEMRLSFLSAVESHMEEIEKRLWEVVKEDHRMKLLQTIPGVGKVLSVVICYEMGDVERFPSAGKFSSYCGLVPRVRSSGGKTFYGRTPKASKRILKWAFVEAATVVGRWAKSWSHLKVARDYLKIKSQKGHGIAAVAVARRLACSAWWVLKKEEPYRNAVRPGGELRELRESYEARG